MSVVKVTLIHPATTATVMEKRLILSSTIEQVKAVCATHFQTPVEEMTLKIFDGTGKAISGVTVSDDKMLGYYQVQDGWTIEVHDNRGEKAKYIGISSASIKTGEAEGEDVEKYVMPESDYLKRPDNMRIFKEQMKEKLKQEALAAGETLPEEINDDSFQEEAAKIKVEDRCQVFPGDRLGTVRYVGRLKMLKPGFWIGVEYDEPVGKNDGAVKGQRVFECKPNYGGFVRPKDVTVGDFPAEEF